MPKQFFTPITEVNGTTLNQLPPAQALRAVRTNALGSLYYFIKVPLRRSKLTDNLHLPLCKFLEREHLKDLIEWPRDHFKSTMASEGLIMWRALPFNDLDAEEFAKLGYWDDFIQWMAKSHNPNARSLIVSENKDNAAKLGRRIRFHFESNPLFRGLFSDILPDANCKWDTFSMTIKRPSAGMGGAHGEGTFDFIGVGGALQSRHYGAGGLIIQDDLVGRKAIESQAVMDKTIEFHKLVTALFEEEDAAHEGDELIIGNRWGYFDLNSHVREHEPWYKVTSHSALGGCCPVHPPDTPILPSVFSYDKLMRKRTTLGSYNFSCQFLNNPSAPENAEFNERDVCWFQLKTKEIEARLNVVINPLDSAIVHEVKDGVVHKPVKLNHLTRCLVTDPNHSGNNGSGRCRHAIVVVGLDFEGNYYLLDSWAMASSYDTYFGELYRLARKWQITKVGFETVAAQKFAAYHLGHLNKTQPWKLKIVECKGEVQLDDGTVSKKKKFRIHGVIAPILESGRFWMMKTPSGEKKHQDFLSELTTFSMTEGGGKFLDQLDAWAYVPQVLKAPQSAWTDQMRLYQHQKQMKEINRPYVAVN